VQRTQVIDLMEALKQSLEGRTTTKSAQPEAKKPAARAKRTASTAKESKRAAR